MGSIAPRVWKALEYVDHALGNGLVVSSIGMCVGISIVMNSLARQSTSNRLCDIEV